MHRFTRTNAAGRTVPDTEYAELTLAMRRGDDPRAVFDALHACGQIRIHSDPAARLEALTALATASSPGGGEVAVVVDTREQSAELGAAIRDRLIAGGQVDDGRVVTTRAGQRIGAGDRIATRRNDRTLGVANRDTWAVTAVDPRGSFAVTPTGLAPGDVTPGGVTPVGSASRVLPANYVAEHVELAYASTVQGVQGDTVAASHLVVGEHTGAAAAYVGMTRGRTTNTAHLVAADLADARQQWIAVFARDRADLGAAHAAGLAAVEAACYAQARPLDEVLTELHAAWTAEQRCQDHLEVLQRRREVLRSIAAVDADHAHQLAALEDRQRQSAIAAQQATQRAQAVGALVTAEADRLRDTLLDRWAAQRDPARQAAQVVLAGPGRLGLRRGAVHRAEDQLVDWADRWRSYLPTLPTKTRQLAAVASSADDAPRLQAAFGELAYRRTEAAHPERARLCAAADAAQAAHDRVSRVLDQARRRQEDRLTRLTAHGQPLDPAVELAGVHGDVTDAEGELAAARTRIAELTAEPAMVAQPPDRLAQERNAWRVHRDAERATRRALAPAASSSRPTRSVRPPEPALHRTPSPGARPGIGR